MIERALKVRNENMIPKPVRILVEMVNTRRTCAEWQTKKFTAIVGWLIVIQTTCICMWIHLRLILLLYGRETGGAGSSYTRFCIQAHFREPNYREKHDSKICCVFFRTAFRSSDRKQYSGLLSDLSKFSKNYVVRGTVYRRYWLYLWYKFGILCCSTNTETTQRFVNCNCSWPQVKGLIQLQNQKLAVTAPRTEISLSFLKLRCHVRFFVLRKHLIQTAGLT